MKAWSRYLYSAALYGLAPLLIWRVWREHTRSCLRRERLGLASVARPAGQLIWLHCASVGEVRAARVLIKALMTEAGEHRLLVTTMTATGMQQLEGLAAESPELSARLYRQFLPLDFPGSARRFVATWQPDMAIMFETELWPNLLCACKQAKVVTAVVNGRLSPRAFRRYQYVAGLMSDTMKNIDWLAAKSCVDADRFERLGLARSRMDVVGSLKFEVPDAQDKKGGENPGSGEAGSVEVWKARRAWVAGSTRDGEEEAVLAAHHALRQVFPDALLVLVPRHPQRFDSVARLCLQQGFVTARRSLEDGLGTDTAVYLGDTLGELGTFYAQAEVAFVGGSLVPLGGHNVVEPAMLGCFTLCGPSLENFEDVAAPLMTSKGLVQVANSDALGAALIRAFEQPANTREMGARARQVVKEQQGALARTLQGLWRLLQTP